MGFRIEEIRDDWLGEDAPGGRLAMTSRARFARNIAGFPFAPHAEEEALAEIDEFLRRAISESRDLDRFRRIDVGSLTAGERSFLKESRLISKEMDRDGRHLAAYISNDGMASILVNEEDHLRIQVMRPGLQVDKAVAELREIDQALARVVGYAYSEKYGYLTACPSNAGTGFRASAMLHLPALTLLQEVEASLAGIAHYGLTVRGFYGENTEFMGDFYQISNEITLGRTVDQIVQVLVDAIGRVLEKEEEARINLFEHHAAAANDSIWRSFALLSFARRMDSGEAMRLLSRVRLGIDKGYFPGLTHCQLNRLMVEIQPGHLERSRSQWQGNITRDEARALFLRDRLGEAPSKN